MSSRLMDTEQARPNSPYKPPEPNTPQHRPPYHRPRRPVSSPNGFSKPFNHSRPLTEQQSSFPRSHERTQEPHQKGQPFNHGRPVTEQQSWLPPRSHERSSAPYQKAQHFNNSRAVAEQQQSSSPPRSRERTPGSHQKSQHFNNSRVVAEQQQSSSPPATHERTPGPPQKSQHFNNCRAVAEQQQQESSSPPRSHERTPGPHRKAQRFINSRPITEHQSPRSHERTPGPHKKASLLLGKVVTLREGFGFLRPESESSSSFGKDVHFKHGDHSKFETGLMALQIGDILEYAPAAFSSGKHYAFWGRLMTCRQRTPVDLHEYVNSLLARCDDGHHVHVLEEVVKCPVGFLMMLGLQRPSAEMVTSVMKLSKLVSDNVESKFNRARLERFFSMFRGSSFLNSPGALREHVSCFSIYKKLMCLFKSFVMTAIKYCPEIGHEIIGPLIKPGSEECYCELLIEFLRMTFHCNSDSSGRLPWHQTPPIPLQNEISETMTRIPLPCVKKSGSYGTVDHYVDTYYQLLREDCFGPLRKGITQLKAGSLDIRDMKVWINVTVEGVKLNDRAPGVTVALKASRMSSHNGKKLLKCKPPMNGNLICLSLDGHFKSPFWAVVHRCEEMDDRFIFVLVEILMGPSSSEFSRGVDSEDSVSESIARLLTTANSNATFVENPSFYKTYEPVLRGLQEMPWENFPFLDEIVYTRWPHQPPDYLSNSSVTVDWSCIFGEKNELRSDTRSVDGLINAGYKVILDDSQLKAVKLALNNRLVLIQGPPGTGKTFVATKILKMLLSASTPSGPVLVITYKNQGLDNFLQRCLEFCPSDLVRIGGRSTEASLEAFNLRAKIKRYDELKGEYDENLEKLGDAKREMEKAIQQVYNCSSFDVESFVSIINDVQLWKFLFEKDPTDPYLLIPEGMAIADFLHDDSVNSKKLQSSIRQILKNWIPKQETFKQVKECLAPESTESLSNGLKLIGEDECEDDVNEVKIWTEQYLEAKQENENLTPGFFGNNESRKELQEMKDNMFKPDNSTKDNFFKHITLFDINTTQHHWLLDQNLWDLNQSQRAILVQIIMEKNRESAINKLRDAKKTYDSICTALEDIDRRRKLKALQSAKIVGMTTTGAAMYREILGALKPSIVMVEEAAEVLEPQLLVAIGPSVQHLILIGDHKQLSPSVEVYELEMKHNFTVSLFERLIEHNNLPFQALGHQSRMREEFVPLIKSIYPKLQTNIQFVSDDRNKAPACMSKSMYFWCHAYQEESRRSVSNKGEATMVVALLRWLISEGQSLEEITVLCAYNGQTTLLRKMLQSNQDLRDAQVTSIDRFQGSENKVIILSLVRCNGEGKIGYLGKLNRYCVAVSRARGGLYLCGNEDTLKNRNNHWTLLFEYMRGKGCMGEKLPVQCPRHPDKKLTLEISNRNLENFKPQLCKRICNAQLSCGHSCDQSCHFGDHPKCEIVIRFRFKDCGHEGARKCSQTEDMVSCQQKVFHTFLLCDHSLFVQCSQKTKQDLKCHELCGKKLDCGHPCKLQCFEDCKTNECTVCIEIKEAKLKQEKQQRMQQIKMILEELDNEIKQLESSPISDPCITDLKEDDAEYMQAKDRTEKFIQPGHKMALVVTKVQKVINPKLEIEFRQARKSLVYPDVEPQLLFHGTDDAAINGITKEGFRLPNAGKRNMFGRGCYFATDSSKSAQNMYTKGSNKLLLCAVLLGQAWTVQEDYPKMDAEKLRKKQCDSLFSKRGGEGTGGTLYDEYIVYNPNQAFPRYIVHYRILHNPNPSAASMFSHNLTRIPIKSSEALVTNTSHDYHFRLAESQFYRMSTSHKFKVTQVDVIFNKQLEDQYEKAKGKLGNNTTEMLVFHGTNHAAIEKIVLEGFKIGGKGVEVRHGACYGAGVYTATNPDISISYCRGEQRMLLSSVLGCLDTHYSHGASKDVLVVKREDYLLPRYIVYFEGST